MAKKTFAKKTFQQFVRKLPLAEMQYYLALHEAFSRQPCSVLRLPYRPEFEQILGAITKIGYKKTERAIWLNLLKCQAMPGWSTNQEAPEQPNCIKMMLGNHKEALADFLMPLYYQQNLSVNKLPYSQEFEAIHTKTQEFLGKWEITKEGLFLFLKNMCRAKKGSKHQIGKRTQDRQARFRGEGFGL